MAWIGCWKCGKTVASTDKTCKHCNALLTPGAGAQAVDAAASRGQADAEALLGCLGYLFLIGLLLGGLLAVLYALVRFVKWAWIN